MSAQSPKRTTVQRHPLAATRIHEEVVTIVGAGAAGRQIALQLVALGIPKLTVIDPAMVAPPDVSAGGFHTGDVGHPKVDAVADVCHQANPQLDFTGLQERFRPGLFSGTSLFCCVDIAAARKVVWLGVERRCRFWADVRVTGETTRLLVATDEPSKRRYAAVLGEKTSKHRRKTAPTFVCSAGLAASLAVHQYTRYLRGLSVDDEVEFDPLGDRYEAHGFMHE
jgi:hypothetical protein